MVTEMPVPENEIGDVKLGDRITMKVRGYPRRWYEARVRSIAPVADMSGSERIVMVQGVAGSGREPEGRDDRRRQDLVRQADDFEIASRRAIRWIRTEFWEYLP